MMPGGVAQIFGIIVLSSESDMDDILNFGFSASNSFPYLGTPSRESHILVSWRRSTLQKMRDAFDQEAFDKKIVMGAHRSRRGAL